MKLERCGEWVRWYENCWLNFSIKFELSINVSPEKIWVRMLSFDGDNQFERVFPTEPEAQAFAREIMQPPNPYNPLITKPFVPSDKFMELAVNLEKLEKEPVPE